MTKDLLRRSGFGSVVVVSAVLVAACGSAVASGLSEPDLTAISQEDVTRIISTLADDSMLGRAAFGEGSAAAAAYLETEFEAAGIEPLSGSDTFLQSFAVYELSPSEVSVAVDGETVPGDRLLVRVGAEAVEWSDGAVPVVIVPANGNLMQAAIQPIRDGTSAVVLAGPEHRDAFVQMQNGFLARPSRTMALEDGTSLIVALMDRAPSANTTVTAKVTAAVETHDLANVVGVLPGVRTDEFVLFSAHYDHIGIRPPVDGDSIANGANDDASGTTAVVTLAKYFAERGTPERTLLFVAFTAEEAGGYGSRYFSEQLDPDQVVAMFNIEMIGKPAVEGPNTAWITGFERSSFGELLQAAVAGTEFSFYPDPYPDQNLFYRSDNATLARLGVPAHSISTTPIDVDPDYHQVSDHVETLDLNHMTAAIRAIAAGAETMVRGEATPTRVDPATVND